MSAWATRTLGDVCEITMGQSPDGKSYNATGEGVPLINGPVEFSQGEFGKTIRSKFTTQPSKLCRQNDLILCVRGSTTGRMNIAGFDACIGRGVAAIRAKQYQPWINYFISSKRDEIYELGTGATFPNVSGAMLSGLQLLVPPLLEQQRLVAILGEAFGAITTAKANAEKNLLNARALFESHLQSIFSKRGGNWQEKRLSDVCVFLNGRAYKKSEMLDAGKYPLLRVGNFFTNRDWFYSDLELEPEKYCDTGDLLYAWSASFGPRIWDGGRVIYHYHIWKVLPNPLMVEKQFLLHLLAWDVEQIKKAHGTGTTMTHVSKGSMENRVLPIPPVKEQASVVALLDNLTSEAQRLESIYEQKLAALEALKKSLLHQAFAGAL